MTRPTAYSYLRFSTPEQIKGDSLRRQLELSRSYASNNDLSLDENLTFRDLGMSAFHGKNIKDGELGTFVEAVKLGKIKKGSYLLVESLDRLSRDKVNQAYLQFSAILESGVKIVTLTDHKVYDINSINDNFGDLMLSLTIMYRSHEESAIKSKRIIASWEAKRQRAQEGGEKLTSRCPAWMKLNKETGKFELIEDKVKLVKKIFKMTLGGIGKGTIAKRFNEERVPTFGKSKGWQTSYIQKILESEAVLGRFQPMKSETVNSKKKRIPDGDVIEKYFPPVVDRKVFLKAKKIRKNRGIKSGPKGFRFSNLFSGLAYCGACKSTMYFLNKGKPPKGGSYLACSGAIRKTSSCNYFSWKYKNIENLILTSLQELKFTELYPKSFEEIDQIVENLQDELLIKSESLNDAEKFLKSATDLLVARPDSTALMTKFDKLESEIDKLKRKIEGIKEEIEEEKGKEKETRQNLAESLEAMNYWLKQQNTSDAEKAYNERSRLNQLLKKLTKRIRFYPKASLPKSKDKLEFIEKETGELHGLIVISFLEKNAAQRVIGIFGDQSYSFSSKRADGKIISMVQSKISKKKIKKAL